MNPPPPTKRLLTHAVPSREPTQQDENDASSGARIPLGIQANYFEPLRRTAHYGLPVCDLQLRSYYVRNLEFMCDFALRAAYYAGLPASGPIPLPRKIERWTVPRGNFVHKKSQENFERITLKRLIQIKDGSPQTVELWLAFLRKHQYHGVGMKANVWSWDEIGAFVQVPGGLSRGRSEGAVQVAARICASDLRRCAMMSLVLNMRISAPARLLPPLPWPSRSWTAPNTRLWRKPPRPRQVPELPLNRWGPPPNP